MAYLPLPLKVRDRANAILRSFAARGFGCTVEAAIEIAKVDDPEDHPDGVYERDGILYFNCRACDQRTPLECDTRDFDYDSAYCGRSPRCIP
jgi:hypothetical protein